MRLAHAWDESGYVHFAHVRRPIFHLSRPECNQHKIRFKTADLEIV